MLAFSTNSAALAEQISEVSAGSSNIVGDTYPHIGELENAILGENFPGQPISERLGRMEKKAFGSVSTSPSLRERTDALDDYTDKQLHKKLLQANVDDEITNSADNQSGNSSSDYPHVTALEQAILAQTFAGQPLAERLRRMEIKAFGKVSTNSDLGERTDMLETYAEKKLHKRPLAVAQNDVATANSQGGGLLSKVEHALLGMAGGPGMVPGFGGVVGKGGGFGFGGGGLGGSGMGFGGMGTGLAPGGKSRRQAAQQEEADPPKPKLQEDPAVHQVTAPDPSAKLIVKVGWCEVKVFGHTFPEMHLPDRLGQLNRELKFEPAKSNMQLMDDIGLMIKTIQAHVK